MWFLKAWVDKGKQIGGSIGEAVAGTAGRAAVGGAGGLIGGVVGIPGAILHGLSGTEYNEFDPNQLQSLDTEPQKLDIEPQILQKEAEKHNDFEEDKKIEDDFELPFELEDDAMPQYESEDDAEHESDNEIVPESEQASKNDYIPPPPIEVFQEIEAIEAELEESGWSEVKVPAAPMMIAQNLFEDKKKCNRDTFYFQSFSKCPRYPKLKSAVKDLIDLCNEIKNASHGELI